MEISEFTFKLMLLFLPGIICAYIVNELTAQRNRAPFVFTVQSFVFALISYFSFWVLVHALSLWKPELKTSLHFLSALSDPQKSFSLGEIVKVSVWAVLIGLAFAWAEQNKFLNRCARRACITKKFGEKDVWGYFFNSPEIEWVTVRDHTNDLIYDGWVQAFSDDSEGAEILLRDVSVYRNSTRESLYQVGALYLAKNRENISIECRTIPVSDIVKQNWKGEQDDHTKNQSESKATSTKCSAQ